MSKLTRIISQLQKAKDKGVKEIDLLKDWETASNARVIRHRVNKILGDSNAVVTKDGVWYLEKNYWNITKSEFQNYMWRNQINEMSSKIIILAVVAIVALIITMVFSYQAGRPNNFYECSDMFDISVVEVIE